MDRWEKRTKTLVLLVLGWALIMMPLEAAAESETVAIMSAGGSSISWTPIVATDGFVLTVSVPDGSVFQQQFGPGETPSFRASIDGSYSFELRGIPQVADDVREALAAARESSDESVADRLREQVRLPEGPMVEAGTFTVTAGAVVDSTMVEASPSEARNDPAAQTVGSARSGSPDTPDTTFTDSLCVGFDCPASPAFGDSTILLMENNTRIKFDDTSAAPFPNRDWQLRANESSSGGANSFSIQDCGTSAQGGCSGNLPFTILAGVPNNSLFVGTSGRVGFRTSTPVVELHSVDGDTPTLRLEQDGSSGFTPQTWDLAGNEGSFFVRDVTGGSQLPFRIQPGADTNSLYIASDNDIGMGTSSPEASLEITRNDGTARLQIEETNATVTGRTMFDLFNNGNVQFFFTNTNSGDIWQMSAFSTAFQISSPSTGRGKFRVFKTGGLQALDGPDEILFLDNNGNLTVTSVTETSSRAAKTGFEPVDSLEVLDKVAALPLSRWSYTSGDPAVRHLGPMAEDFHASFGLGKDNTGLTNVDTAGVAFAAIQGLNAKLTAKDARIQELEARLSELEAMVQALAGE